MGAVSPGEFCDGVGAEFHFELLLVDVDVVASAQQEQVVVVGGAAVSFEGAGVLAGESGDSDVSEPARPPESLPRTDALPEESDDGDADPGSDESATAVPAPPNTAQVNPAANISAINRDIITATS